MSVRLASMALVLAVPVLAAGCGDDPLAMRGPMSPTGPGPVAAGVGLVSVSPPSGAVGVAPQVGVVLGFGGPMGPGMEQYVDLHRGALDGPTVAMQCAWSGDRTQLTCTPHEPLRARTTYWLHLGAGMRASSGEPVGLGPYGPAHGGHWVSGEMLHGSHAGHAWGAMGPGWRDDDGHYGMAFTFTTA